MHKVNRRLKSLIVGQKGFTLIELLVVVTILGVLAAVAVPSVAIFIDDGNDAARETELHDVQVAVIAMMTEANVATMSAIAATGDMDLIGIDTNDPADGVFDYVASDYMVGLNTDGTVKSGHTYSVDALGVVTQAS